MGGRGEKEEDGKEGEGREEMLSGSFKARS